ncbi:alpha/beta hydrolase [Luteolibacter ambystomatis]|uniref:Alpha/beta hydrolase n=1 Tax=Luteolibacter ambystomatis TaxID=2824561 RepID=A0A975PGZ1_9BACT|nr:alpha/beta hydrolase [Luteolibacter ambystomatis]QUE53229.1 alpha/beta hydrolase [Luteolibacter ambystomatis]
MRTKSSYLKPSLTCFVRLGATAVVLAGVSPLLADEKELPAAPMAKPDAQMQLVLDELAALNGKPVNELSAGDARKQPSPADAVEKLMKKQDKSQEKVDTVDNITIKLSSGDVKGRIYRPASDGPFPVILYIHGGGWVLADLDTYDATPRALANAAQALVISTDYRKAPEHKFPSAHEDCFGAYQWTLENAGRFKGDAKRVALVGESAGGNMAAAVSIMAQAKGMQMPVHQALIYPVANVSMDTPSYRENAMAKPLNALMMKWFFDQELANPTTDSTDPKIALLKAKTLKGLPSTTIITAQIDPLRSDGEMLAKKLQADGVTVNYRNYEGVTHEFFGMGGVVDKAKDAVGVVASDLKDAFAGRPATASTLEK